MQQLRTNIDIALISDKERVVGSGSGGFNTGATRYVAVVNARKSVKVSCTILREGQASLHASVHVRAVRQRKVYVGSPAVATARTRADGACQSQRSLDDDHHKSGSQQNKDGLHRFEDAPAGTLR